MFPSQQSLGRHRQRNRQFSILTFCVVSDIYSSSLVIFIYLLLYFLAALQLF